MVLIAPPPPKNTASPLFYDLPAGSSILRIFDPTRYSTQALTFRFYGAVHRFDHHRSKKGKPQVDSERGIYYAAFTLSGCLVECFGDTGILKITDQCVAYVTLTRSLHLLDLRGSGAMKAGSVSALAKTADRGLSQEWSRYFYENEALYSPVDGIVYYNAHNDEEALALYERSQDGLASSSNSVLPLKDVRLRPAIQQVAVDNNLIFVS